MVSHIKGLKLEGDVDPVTMRPSTVRQLSGALDQWAGMLENVDSNDVPYAAQQYHETMTKRFSLLSAMTNSLATGGALALLAYGDAVEEFEQSWDETRAAGTALCGNAWDRFQDRIPLQPMEPLERPLANADITFAEGQLVVLTEAMNPRPDPDTSDDPVARVAAGEEVTIVGGPQESDNFTWWEVLLAGGPTSGWVVEDFIETVD